LSENKKTIGRFAVAITLLAASLFGCQLPITGSLPGKAATGVSLNKETLTLSVGASEKLIATVAPSNAANKAVSWQSSSASVGVDATGRVTAQAAGSAVVTVTTLDGSFTDTCQVTAVATVPVTGVSLDRHSATLPYGKTQQLVATVLPSNATNKAVTWSSSGSAVAVSSAGLVTANALGSATVTATTIDGSFTDTCAFTVIPAVSLNKASTTLAAGRGEVLVATVLPSSAPNKAVTWTTSNPDIVAISDGQILAIKGGTATITATAVDGSNAATCAVTVTGSLTHTYSEVLPAANALQSALDAALASNDSTQSAYCEFVTTPSWLVTMRLNAYKPAGSIYTISGTITAPVNQDYSVGAMNGTATLTGGVVTGITYRNAVFALPRSGYVDIVFMDGVTGTMDLSAGTFTEKK